MRRLVVTEFVSLDGIMEGPGGDNDYVHGAWTMPYWCSQIGAYKAEELVAADTLLLGRVTYQGFAEAWPQRSGDPFSDKMNSMQKLVATTTLRAQDLTWSGAEPLDGAVDTALPRVKDTQGGDILVVGSATLVHHLLALDLVDELRLAVYPLTLGTGLSLYPAGTRLDFELAESRPTETGVMLLTYKRGGPPQPSDAFPFPQDADTA